MCVLHNLPSHKIWVDEFTTKVVKLAQKTTPRLTEVKKGFYEMQKPHHLK